MATPGTMLRTTWAQVDATSLTDFSRVLTDNITSNQVVLWMLGQLGGIVTRQGKTIFEPIMLDDAASAKWYSGYDPLDMTRTDVATGAEYAFKQLAGVEQISGFEKFQNSGPGQIIDLWDAMGQRLAITMKRKVNQALPADGSASRHARCRRIFGLCRVDRAARPFELVAGSSGNRIFHSGGSQSSPAGAGAGSRPASRSAHDCGL